MAFDAAFAKKIQDHVHGGTALPQPTGPFRLRQMTAAGTATTPGTELATGGGYTSGTGAPTIAFGGATTASPSVASSSGVVSVTNMPATTIPAVEIWNSNGTPERQEFGNLTTPKTTNAGDTLTYAAGAVTSALT